MEDSNTIQQNTATGQQTYSSVLKEHADNNHELLDNTRYQQLIDLYDAYENPQDDQIAAALPYKLLRQFNNEQGINGIDAYSINRPVIDNFIGNVRKQRSEAEKAAEQAAIDAANADIEVANGTDTPYKVTKDFSDWYKEWAAIYNATSDPAKRANMVKTLSEKMKDSGLPYMEVAEIGTDENGKAIDPYYAYMEQFLGDGTDTSKFSQMRAVLNAAAKDRTPVTPQKKSFSDIMMERREKQIEADRATEARRLERERLGRGIGDLAATIGDIVRASQGAPVTQRDWQRIYDNLTAQEKANINNYQVRMAKLQEDARAERALQQKLAYQTAKDAADKEFMKGQKAADRKLQLDIANLKDKRDRYFAFLRWGQGGKDDKSKTHTLLLVGDNAILIPKGQSFLNAVNSLYDILNKKDNYVSGNARITITDNAELENDPQGFFNRNIQNILSNYWDDLKPETQTLIKKKLKQFQGEWVTGVPSSGTSDSNNENYNDDNVEYDPNDPTTWF